MLYLPTYPGGRTDRHRRVELPAYGSGVRHIPIGHMYTLWQTGVQLGHLIHVQEQSSEDGKPIGIAGVLFPAALTLELRAVRQTRFVALPGSPVVQEFQDEEPRTGFDPHIHVVPMPAFMRLGPDGTGAPRETIFSIRTEGGADVPSYVIEIDRQDLPPDVGAAALREIGLPEHLRSVCVVRVVYEEEELPAELIEAVKRVRSEMVAAITDATGEPPSITPP
jgi:hypothetical protein